LLDSHHLSPFLLFFGLSILMQYFLPLSPMLHLDGYLK
jgi:hypothetical protein